MVISWILNTVNDSIKKSLLHYYGAKKYTLNKQLYEAEQQNRPVSEYYTHMRTLWLELESLSMMSPITEVNTEISAFIRCMNEQKEELKLFQFLNGLDDDYGLQRSQILMQTQLPTVEEACNMIQQEESQREIFKQEKKILSGHTYDKCWTIVAYPSKGPRSFKGKGKDVSVKGPQITGGVRWNKGRQEGKIRASANACT
ncbi:Na(+)-translocating NADH-quinone reductase subunit A [Bienertia sinuspersici]